MKKIMSLLLVLALAIPVGVLAEDVTTPAVSAATTANAVAECENTYDLTAPFSGVVQPFSWKRGDKVAAQDIVFTLDTTKIYAPESGTVQGMFITEGELCEDVIARYGMIASIEKNQPLVIDASTKGKYDSDENQILHLGNTVYFEQSNDKDNEGEGSIIALNGEDYTVELTAGEFDVDDTVKIYRDEKMGSKTCIGQGTIVRDADRAVTGSGRVIKSYYRQGQTVRKGQLMFELASADASPETLSSQIAAGHDGVMAAAQVISGQQVYKGQLLATVHDVSAMQVVAEVDEMDLDKIAVGASIPIVFDRYPGVQVAGTVRSISQMGKEKQNATYYDVKIAFTTSVEVLPGMNATVYLPDAK